MVSAAFTPIEFVPSSSHIGKDDGLNYFHQSSPWLACFDLSRISLCLSLSLLAFYFRPLTGSDGESLI